MPRQVSLLVLMLLTESVVYSASAATVTHNFGGTITNFTSAPVPNVEVGTVFTGSFSYDSGLSCSLCTATTSFYVPGTVEIDFTSPSNIQSALVLNNARVRVDNNNSCDSFSVDAGQLVGIPFQFNGSAMQFLRVGFIDCNATVFGDTSLPIALQFGSFTTRTLELQRVSPFASSSGTITTLTAGAAALTELDFFVSGDGLLTRDTDTGLDWLDVSATSGLSFNSIVADVGGWASLGFRHATATELCALFAIHAAVPASGCPTGNVAVTDRFTSALHDQFESFIALLGATTCASGCNAGFPFTDYVATEGWFDDELGTSNAGRATLFYTVAGNQTSVGVRSAVAVKSFSAAQYGNWLVRDAITDADEDGVSDLDDNCPSVVNPDQTDTDLDGTGDACDSDDDNDGFADGADNCPLVANPSQADADGDGLGNPCDGDLDGDGFANAVDNCPAASNPDQTDTDQDGLGDECDTDDDGDGLFDANDNCPAVQNPGQDDLDGDGIGDSCDSDLDGDGVENQADNCAIDANVGQDDTDGDGIGDVCDSDADNDSVANGVDNCPLVANLNQSDSDNDGSGDACDSDLDGDGVANGADNCPIVANSGQTDFDGDGLGDACDGDADGDGVANGTDECAATPIGTVTDPAHGCSIAQLCPCDGPRGTVMPWRNHGKYVSCVAHAAGDFESQGLISQAKKNALVSAAGQSSCGQ